MDGVFVKRGDPRMSSLEGESAALRWLADEGHRRTTGNREPNCCRIASVYVQNMT